MSSEVKCPYCKKRIHIDYDGDEEWDEKCQYCLNTMTITVDFHITFEAYKKEDSSDDKPL
jgi:uncharacterized metal-binding protein YceD (DUF177 family)